MLVQTSLEKWVAHIRGGPPKYRTTFISWLIPGWPVLWQCYFFKLFRLKNTLQPLYVLIRVTRYCSILLTVLYCILCIACTILLYSVGNTHTIEYSTLEYYPRETHNSLLQFSNLRYSEIIEFFSFKVLGITLQSNYRFNEQEASKCSANIWRLRRGRSRAIQEDLQHARPPFAYFPSQNPKKFCAHPSS